MWEGSYTFKIVHHTYTTSIVDRLHAIILLCDSDWQSVVHEITFIFLLYDTKKVIVYFNISQNLRSALFCYITQCIVAIP